MHECTERETREADRVWKTRSSQTLAVQLDTGTGFPSRLGEAGSMLMTGKSCGGVCSCLHSQHGTSYTSSE